MATIDEKIVELKLDNSQFNKASDVTIGKLEQLKQSLNMDAAADSFNDISKAAKSVSLDTLERGVESVGKQFSALGTIADQVLRNIGNQVFSVGEKMLKSVTIDQITSGWSKYGQKTEAVQTIMAATSKEFGNVGNQMELVEEQLNRLNWFTDETSYKFVEMSQNIGKFTSAGVKLETAVTAMEGISTWASRSGANVNEAGRAMYNLSQAMAVGAVKLMDWRSIENANMGTLEFKQTAIDTAVELGTLTKAGEGLYKTLKGTTVSATNFTDSLSEAWFSSEVLLKTLDKYGGFANELNKLYEETGVATATLISLVDDYSDGTLDMEKAMTITGLSASELTGWLEKLGSEEMKLGKEAFKASQESKTFADVIGYLQEAVGSGWMRTFENIFGNYEEAKEIWSELAEGLYEVFVMSGEVRNGLLEMWKADGGRDVLIDAVRTLLVNIYNIIETVKGGFRDIFPPATVDTLMNFTYGFARLVDYLTPSEQGLETIRTIVASIARVLKTLMAIAGQIFDFISPALGVLNMLAGLLVSVIADAMEFASIKFQNLIDQGGLQKVLDIFRAIASGIIELVKGGIPVLKERFGGIFDFLSGLSLPKLNFGKIVEKINEYISPLISNFTSLENVIGGFGNTLARDLSNVGPTVEVIGSKLMSFFEMIFANFSKLSSLDLLNIGLIAGIGVMAVNLFKLSSSLSGMFESIGETVESFKKGGGLDDTVVLQWAALIGALTVAFVKLSAIPLENLMDSILILGAAIGAMLLVVKNAETLVGDRNNQKALKLLGTFLIELGITVDLLTLAVSKIASLDPFSALQGVAGLGLVMAELAGFVFLLQKIKPQKMTGVAVAMNLMAVALTALVIPVGLLGSMRLETLAKGIGAVALMLLSVAGAAAIFQQVKTLNLMAAALAMDLMAPAMLLMAASIRILGGMDLLNLASGVLGVAASMGILAAGAYALSKMDPVKLLASGEAIDILAGSLEDVTDAVKELAELDTASMIQGVLGVTGMLAGLVAAIGVLAVVSDKTGSDGDILKSSAAILILSISLHSLAGVVERLGSLTWSELGKGLLGLAAGLAALVAAGAVATQIVPGLAALASVLLSLAAVIGAIALASFAIGFLAMATSVAGGAQQIVRGLRVLIDELEVNSDLFPRMVDMIFNTIGEIVSRFLLFIPALVPQIVLAAASILRGFLQGMAEVAPDIFAFLLIMLQGLLKVIADIAPDLIDTIVALIDALTDGLPKIVAALTRFLYALGDELINILTAMLGFVMHSVGLGPVWDWLTGVGDEANKRLEDVLDDIGETIKDGSAENAKLTAEAGDEEASAYLDAYDERLDRHSPPGEIVERAEDNGDAFYDTSTSPQVLGQFEDAGEAQGESYVGKLISYVQDKVSNLGNGLFNFSSGKEYKKEDTTDRTVGVAGMTQKEKKAFMRQQEERKKAAEEAAKSAEKSGENIGTSFNDALANSLSSGKTSSGSTTTKEAKESVKTVVETVEETYRDELEHLEADAKTEDLQFNLWESLNVDVDETEKKAKQIEYTNRKITFQIERMRIAGEKYEQILEGMGADAIETKEAYNEWLQEQIDLEELQNQLYDLQNEAIQKNNDLLEKIERGEKQKSQAYKLWSALNPEATEAQKSAAELANLNNELDVQVQKTQYYATQYREAVSQYGSDSNEALDAYSKYVDSLTSVVEKQNEITEKQKESITDQSEAFRNFGVAMGQQATQEKAYSDWEAQLQSVERAQREYNNALREFGDEAKITQSKLEKLREEEETLKDMQSAGANQKSLRQSLLEQGFSEQEVADYFKRQAGIQTQIAEDVVDLSLENLVKQAAETNDVLIEALTVNLQDSTAVMLDVGRGYTEAIGTGMTDNTEEAVTSATTMLLDAASQVQDNADIYKEFDTIGYQLDMGVKAGIERGESEVINAIIAMVRAAIAAAKATAGIHSPSKITTEMGYFLDKGLINGIEKNAAEVARSAAKTIKSALNSMASVLHTDRTLDFSSRMLLGGLTNGAQDYSSQLLKISTKFVEDTNKEFEETFSGATKNKDIFEMLGLDFGDLSYDIVVNLDTDKAEEDLTDLEKAIIKYRDAQTRIDRMDVMEWDEWLGPSSGYDRYRELSEMARGEFRGYFDGTIPLEQYQKQWERQRQWDAEHLTYTEMLHPEDLKDLIAEYTALNNRHFEVTEEYEQYVRDFWNGPSNALAEIAALIEDLTAASETGTVEQERLSYTQNIYSTRPLSTLDVYRNTNQLLSKFQ